MDGACSMYGEEEKAYKDLVGKPQGKRPLGITRHRWEDNIKIDIQEVGWGAWTGLIWLLLGGICPTELVNILCWLI